MQYQYIMGRVGPSFSFSETEKLVQMFEVKGALYLRNIFGGNHL